ncbi:MAG: LPS assembly lipoprotein LptE [Proteobacteria bacterium]|nr:LPS assembly lipoprotein LptE [Pseudomonadota bacterium]
MLRANSLALLLVVLSACSYSFTSLKNPYEKKGVKTVSVSIFKNKTIEGGAEVFFTDSLRLYLVSRSGKLELVRSGADAYIEGEVRSITLIPASIQMGTAATEAAGGLPADRLLATTYTITVTASLKMIRAKDEKTLWTNTFSQAQTMNSGSYTDERETSNVFIKESNKRAAIQSLADQMMKFAVDSLLEEF